MRTSESEHQPGSRTGEQPPGAIRPTLLVLGGGITRNRYFVSMVIVAGHVDRT